MTRRTRVGAFAAAAAAAALLAGCADDTPQNALEPHGMYAGETHELIKPVFAIAGVVFVLVQGLVVWCVIAYRRKGDDDRPEQIHGHAGFEIGWTIVPALILLVVGVLTVNKIFFLEERHPEALQVDVIGHQWWWEYNYLDRDGRVIARTANELHIPVGQKVQLKLTSADVIHNYWPPKLAGKVYAIPGRTNHMTIEADDPDFYYGQCTEYCGLSHANMRLRVVAQPQAEFDRWLRGVSIDTPSQAYGIVTAQTSATATEVQKGYTIFLQKGCSGCHAVNGIAKGIVGPDLTYFNTRATFAGAIFDNTDDNLRAWLRDPPAEKPGSLMPKLNLSEAEITSLIAYLRTLGDASLRGTVPSGQAAAPAQP